ncbi:hypothetical protein FB45DRAFT_902270 [Roridomyces roridus]|uniref:FAD-binding domain-containing protein n=1 Tax=Roridomyces roridus TaxID=1738132 RepID=A0AAD7C3C9_9AGAR|nr:hypothetical protein FB45DRAFT_902270 [Roridomyces roridus]
MSQHPKRAKGRLHRPIVTAFFSLPLASTSSSPSFTCPHKMSSSDRLDFIIVGASVAGLGAAISLKNSGHNVLILEKSSRLAGAESGINGCARVPPNGNKVLKDWGLEAKAKAAAAVMPGWAFYKYFSGEGVDPVHLGNNIWSDELSFEAQGGYAQYRYQELIGILYEEAIRAVRVDRKARTPPRVSVLFDAEVVSIDCDTCTVTLRSGETHTGDAILGADGARGVVRQILMDEEGVSLEDDVPTGMSIYSSIIPKQVVFDNGLDEWFYKGLGTTIWMGPNRAFMACPVGGNSDLTIFLYTTENPDDRTWTEEASIKITDVLGQCDPRLEKLASLAGKVTCIQIKKPYALESWVSESGKVLAIGEAAHPFPPGGLHPFSISLEDGASIGRMFSHTQDPSRVPEFFRAFQEHRENRCARIRDVDQEYVEAMTIPDETIQAARDAGMLANHAAGRNALDGDLQQMHDDFRMVFGYDAADASDEWWINWGRYRDPAAAVNGHAHNLFRDSFAATQVVQVETADE